MMSKDIKVLSLSVYHLKQKYIDALYEYTGKELKTRKHRVWSISLSKKILAIIEDMVFERGRSYFINTAIKNHVKLLQSYELDFITYTSRSEFIRDAVLRHVMLFVDIQRVECNKKYNKNIFNDKMNEKVIRIA